MITIEKTKEGFKLDIQEHMSEDFILTLIKELKESSPIPEPVVEVTSTNEPVINIRDRLPNLSKATIQNGKDSETIDIKRKSAEISTHKFFRCPECGQSHVAVIGSDVVIRDIDDYDKHSDDQPLFIVKNVEATEPYSVLSQNAIDKVKGLVGDGELEGYCPRCDKSNILEKWFDAWLNPESYFDHESPCPLCGDEMMMAITTDKAHKPLLVCENKECNYKMEG